MLSWTRAEPPDASFARRRLPRTSTHWMEMKTRLLLMPLLLALVASLAACGGGGSGSVPANAVAVVGGKPITTGVFNALFQQALHQVAASGQQAAPAPGTPQYTAMRGQVLAYLVQVTELE